MTVSIIFLMLLTFTSSVFADSAEEIDQQLQLFLQYIDRDIAKATVVLQHLTAEKIQFTQEQSNKFVLYKASYLGFVGLHKERIDIVQSVIENITDQNLKVKFLNQLSASYTALGEYDNALNAMNQSILLLPTIDSYTAQIGILHSAATLLSSLRAYDDALSYADRIISLPSPQGNFQAKCIGYANKVQINFERGNHADALSLMKDAIDSCNANGRKSIVLFLRGYEVIDLIEEHSYQQGIKLGLPLLIEYSKADQKLNNFCELEEAIAKAYLKIGNFSLAETHGLSAYEHEKINQSMQVRQKINTTMALIKRAQGQLAAALEYSDAALVLKDKVLNEQLQKSVAYQRVKFDMQDKANQMSLLEEKNKVLRIEQQLEKRNNQLLLIAVIFVMGLLLSILIWLMKTLEQKNRFRQFSQTDGLTQVANRMHFMTCATDIFEKNSSGMSIILFDMDLFKKVNDTFGHATGDWVLKTVTEVVQSQLRKVDLFGRLGGEEFAICMPDSNSDTALQLAERCRNAIESIDTTASGHQFKLSASFGVASFPVSPNRTFKATLEAADQALYLSKSRGRNCVSVHHQ